jgi:hypothetical protein
MLDGEFGPKCIYCISQPNAQALKLEFTIKKKYIFAANFINQI